MFSERDLVGVGFSPKDARKCMSSNYFVLVFKNKSLEDLKTILLDIRKVYGFSSQQVGKAIASFAPFAGLKHYRGMRQALRLGKLVGVSKEEIVMAIIEKPVLSSYSQKRNLAAIDAFRHAVEDS